VFGGDEAALGLGRRGERVQLGLPAEVVVVLLKGVHLQVRELALADAHYQRQLLLGQRDLLVVVLVVDGPEGRGARG
jgi:hypothetical protein